MQTTSSFVLSHQFHSLSEENTRLNQNLISITLSHENLLGQNKKLTEQLKKKDYSLIQSTLRQKNRQHTLDNVKEQYQKLQDQYKDIFDWMNAQKKLAMRDLYKKQSQLAMDMAFIQGQSYRQSKRLKNEQLESYQKKLILISKENQTLKSQILKLTSEYNFKIYELKSSNLEKQMKIRNYEIIESEKNKMQDSITRSLHNDNSFNAVDKIKLQTRLQSMKQKLELYVNINEQIKRRNTQLFNQNQQLYQNQKGQTHVSEQPQDDLIKILKQKNCTIEYFTQLFQENAQLRKQIQQISTKYTLLSDTYPQLMENSQTIIELQKNIHKLQSLKSLQNQISQEKLKSQALQQTLINLQKQYIAQLKQRQKYQLRTSILIKRFNEMFIKMNPFFDIYQYESLELDQGLYKFFNENKDYKQLKDYEQKLLQCKRQNQENLLKYESKERQLNMELNGKERLIASLQENIKEIEQKSKELAQSNQLLKNKIKINQENFIQNQNQNSQQGNEQGNIQNNQPQENNLKKLQTQVTLPLLQNLIQKLHAQRELLLITIYKKDQQMIKLSQRIKNLTLNQPIKTIYISNDQKPSLPSSTLSQSSFNFNDLLKQNQQLQNMYDSTTEQFRVQLHKMQQKLNNQHNLYQLQVKKYQQDYEHKLSQIQETVRKWRISCEQFKGIIENEAAKRVLQQQKTSILQSEQKQRQKAHNQQQRIINIMQQQMDQRPLIMRQPSHTNLQRIPTITSQNNDNKMIGQSTVQNLTSTLKKYEHDMNEVLMMCAKISEEYSELKKRMKNQEELHQEISQLKETNQKLQINLNELTKHLQENTQTLQTVQSLYSNKDSQCKELKSSINKEKQALNKMYQQQKKKNDFLNQQLHNIKEKLYESALRPQQAEQASTLNKGEFQTIVVMHANKNKELTTLSEKNRSLQTKVQTLMHELNLVKQKSAESKLNQVSPLEKAELKQLSNMLQETNMIQLLKKAVQIVQKESSKQNQPVQSSNINQPEE